MITFSELVALTESISPKQPTYGTDGSNKEWVVEGQKRYTRFSVGGSRFLFLFTPVSLGTYEIRFSAIIPGSDPSDLNAYTMNQQMSTPEFFKVFGAVMWLTLEAAKHASMVVRIKFTPGYEKLQSFYSTLLKNKTFQKMLLSAGYIVDEAQMARGGPNTFMLKIAPKQ